MANQALAVQAALKGGPVGAAGSQATTIEQSRAIAEVQAKVTVAKACPRTQDQVVKLMREACNQLELAQEAFFKFPRGGTTVTGETIHLAAELARCWGNVDYGWKELARDDDKGVSEILTWAWDVETNTRPSATFLVPHQRDKSEGGAKLTSNRDIYENNANNAARRVREMIFRVLPKWFVNEAAQLCRETLTRGTSDKPFAQQCADVVAAFEKIGVSRPRIEAKIGGRIDAMTPVDLANLRISFKSIRDREVTTEDEFPTIAADTVNQALTGATTKQKPANDPPSSAGKPEAGGAASPGKAPASGVTSKKKESVDELKARLAGEIASIKTYDDLIAWREKAGDDLGRLGDEAPDLYGDVSSGYEAALERLEKL